jgi:hypothetical protein
MAYTINLTDGTIFATVADGTINTSSSMILVGKNYAGYGEFLDENFIHLLENGANTTAPGNPLTGQLWWDKTNNVMKVYNGTTFKVISASTASATAPSSNVAGDLWFDTTNQQLKVYNGASFILVGPASTSGQGTSGAIITTVTDNVAVDHVVVQLFVFNTIVAIVSKDAVFTPQTGIPGFSTIGPGIQLSTAVTSALFRGTATDSQTLDGLDSLQFLRSDANDSTSGTLTIENDAGLSVGLDSDARLTVTTATSAVNLQNQTQDANLNLVVNDGGVTTTALSINGSTATTGVRGLVNLNANGVGNLGSSTGYFNTMFATATTALYADVAERFEADQIYAPGTVVELGGDKEITLSITELSENVFGVISTRAAYLMNGGAGSDETHPPVAMTGRVPVRAVGTIRKGDRLVSAGNGLARSATRDEVTAFNVIGRALEDKVSSDVGTVEAIVTIN